MAARVLFAMRTVWDFQPWRPTDEHVMPSQLAKIEQLNVEPNCEHSTPLHRSSIHCTWWKTGNEGRVQVSRAIRASCAKQATCGVKQWAASISQIPHSNSCYLFTCKHATSAHAVSEAWCRYVFLVFEGVGILNDRSSPEFLEGYVTMKLKPDYRSPYPGLWCVHTVRILFTSDVNDIITETKSDLIWVIIKT